MIAVTDAPLRYQKERAWKYHHILMSTQEGHRNLYATTHVYKHSFTVYFHLLLTGSHISLPAPSFCAFSSSVLYKRLGQRCCFNVMCGCDFPPLHTNC